MTRRIITLSMILAACAFVVRGAMILLPAAPNNVIQISALIPTNDFAYVIQRSTNPASGLWRDVAQFDYSNTPPCWTDTNAPLNAFYRGAAIPYAP
jgi:hypothetical protein